ncbi:MAG: hypothetical protein ACR2P0_08615 [Acidimicrobiales bacterium]
MFFPNNQGDRNEKLLTRRAYHGIAYGMIALTFITFGMIEIGAPEMGFIETLGVSLFMGFWGGPVFGMAGAAAYHGIASSAESAETPVADVTVLPTSASHPEAA